MINQSVAAKTFKVSIPRAGGAVDQDQVVVPRLNNGNEHIFEAINTAQALRPMKCSLKNCRNVFARGLKPLFRPQLTLLAPDPGFVEMHVLDRLCSRVAIRIFGQFGLRPMITISRVKGSIATLDNAWVVVLLSA